VTQKPSFSQSILQMPFLWGGIACLGFYALLGKSTLNHPLIVRYFESHPVEYVTAALFFVGLAALVMKLIGLIVQTRAMGSDLLEPIPSGGQKLTDVPRLLAQLQRAPAAIKNGYLGRRMQAALEFVRRKSDANALDDHLYFLADGDAMRMQSSYAIVRIIVWAIPILGFLGTVIGITLAIAKLSPDALEKSLPTVTAGLSVAFDTTALALALSMVLMFAKFAVERFETRLLSRVDERVNDELLGRFTHNNPHNDPDVAAVRRIADGVLEACEKLVERQAEVWQNTIEAAHGRWAELTTSAGELLEAALSDAVTSSLTRQAELVNQSTGQRLAELNQAVQRTNSELHHQSAAFGDRIHESVQQLSTHVESAIDRLNTGLAQSLQQHVATLSESAERTAAENRQHLNEVQLAVVESAAVAAEHQEQLVKQSEVLLKVVDATGQIKKLESALNSNLSALAGSQNFEQTAASLAATVQLLAARLGVTGERISLDAAQQHSTARSGEAA